MYHTLEDLQRIMYQLYDTFSYFLKLGRPLTSLQYCLTNRIYSYVVSLLYITLSKLLTCHWEQQNKKIRADMFYKKLTGTVAATSKRVFCYIVWVTSVLRLTLYTPTDRRLKYSPHSHSLLPVLSGKRVLWIQNSKEVIMRNKIRFFFCPILKMHPGGYSPLAYKKPD